MQVGVSQQCVKGLVAFWEALEDLIMLVAVTAEVFEEVLGLLIKNLSSKQK